MLQKPRIGVVGGGASAVSLLDALAEEPDLPAGTIMVFEASDHLWRGRPYRPDLDVVRVNAVPDDMSVRAGDSEHLYRWLANRERLVGAKASFTDPISGAQFIPRAVFGDYLEQSARTALLTLLRRGWEPELVRERVESAAHSVDGLVLRTARGATYEVDYAVLSVGAGSPADPYSLTGAEGFVKDPYPTVQELSHIDPAADVAVIGSGLTAVDVVLALTHLGHRGRIRLLSRRGVLPSVRQRRVQHVLRHFKPSRFRAMAARNETVTIADLAAIMDMELRDAGEHSSTIRRELDNVSTEAPVARLRRQLGEVDSPSIALRILQRAVPEAGPDVWPLLTELEKDRFLAGYDREFESLCCPMPPRSAAVLLSLIDSDQLSLVTGVHNVETTADGFMIETTHCDFRTGIVVSAVNGRQRKVSEEARSLVSSLVSAGLAEPHPHGGLRVERATSRLVVDSRPQPRLYALGDPAIGSIFFTVGMESLVDRAIDIVRSIRSDNAAWSQRATA
ncbi:FAD/NAD(P)-binding protein [Actinophytocola sp.]|uniref:FAD/NAD(P)-binding protein n=1 Tax=Actinophytocola sp. TaxID=1872138 RepID=UPI003D6B83A5